MCDLLGRFDVMMNSETKESPMDYNGFPNRLTWNIAMWLGIGKEDRYVMQYLYLMGEGFNKTGYGEGEYSGTKFETVPSWTAERVKAYFLSKFPYGTPDMQCEAVVDKETGYHPAIVIGSDYPEHLLPDYGEIAIQWNTDNENILKDELK